MKMVHNHEHYREKIEKNNLRERILAELGTITTLSIIFALLKENYKPIIQTEDLE